MEECLFCKIIKKEIPSEIVYENEIVLAIKDINPKADFHILILPKKHIDSLDELGAEDAEIAGNLLLVAKDIAKSNNLSGHKVAINTGKQGGQLIDHLHLHLLGGKVKEML